MNDSKEVIFWRDPRMPFLELRKVVDGCEVAYAPHSHIEWSIGAITEGQCSFQYHGKQYSASIGDLVLINPNWVHACNPTGHHSWGYLMLYVDVGWLTEFLFRVGLLRGLEWQDIPVAKMTLPLHFERFCQMAESLFDPEQDIKEKEAEVVGFLRFLFRFVPRNSSPPALSPPRALQRLRQFLDDGSIRNTSLEKLCEISGYSPSHLIRSFKKYYGLTPHSYIINRRVQQGRKDLKKGLSIAEAAVNAGFADQPHFQRIFKRKMAATPNQYRSRSVEN